MATIIQSVQTDQHKAFYDVSKYQSQESSLASREITPEASTTSLLSSRSGVNGHDLARSVIDTYGNSPESLKSFLMTRSVEELRQFRDGLKSLRSDLSESDQSAIQSMIRITVEVGKAKASEKSSPPQPESSSSTSVMEQSLPRIDTGAQPMRVDREAKTPCKLEAHLRDSFIPEIEKASTSQEASQLLSKYLELRKTPNPSPEVQKLLEEAEFKLFFLDVRASNNPESQAASREYFELFYVIPSLQNAKTPEELKALQPYVDACIALEGKVSQTPSQAHQEMKKLFEEKSTSLGKRECVQNIQAKISKLDQKSPYFARDILEIKSEIKRLRSLPGVPPNKFADLERALDLLLNPTPLTISQGERTFMEHIAKKCGISEEQLEGYSKLETPTRMEAQSTLLQALKGGAATPAKLNNIAKRASDAAIASARQNRFLRFAEAHSLSPALNQNFAKNFPSVISDFEKYSQKFLQEFEECCDMMEETYNAQTGGKFSQHLQVLSYMDPHNYMEIVESSLPKRFFESLDLQAIDEAEPKTLGSYLTEAREKLLDPYSTYEAMSTQKMSWLLRNLDAIKDVYCHFKESIFCCWTNSLRRMGRYILDPTLDRSTIKMGSTLDTRKLQATILLAEKDAKKDPKLVSEYSKVLREAPLNYGIKKTRSQPISLNDLGTEVEKLSRSGHRQVMLSSDCSKRSKAGHAFNLHIDQKIGHYGFEDDNIGRVEFSSIEEMKTELETYVRAFYSYAYDDFSIEFYEQTFDIPDIESNSSFSLMGFNEPFSFGPLS
ncbi:MAG: hypothetical protein H7A41_08720 [Chlamydiales bacterium]|nr:hypothetical protein [Chlamydiales bacterium]